MESFRLHNLRVVLILNFSCPVYGCTSRPYLIPPTNASQRRCRTTQATTLSRVGYDVPTSPRKRLKLLYTTVSYHVYRVLPRFTVSWPCFDRVHDVILHIPRFYSAFVDIYCINSKILFCICRHLWHKFQDFIHTCRRKHRKSKILSGGIDRSKIDMSNTLIEFDLALVRIIRSVKLRVVQLIESAEKWIRSVEPPVV